MVGSFCKVFFGILAILAVHSDATECYYKPDNTGILLAEIIGTKEPISGIELNIDQGKDCFGYCALIIGSRVNESNVQHLELAGCQKDIKPHADTYEALDMFIAMNLNAMKVINEVKEDIVTVYSILICNTDNCNARDHNNHKRLMNIHKVVNEGVQQLNGTRSTNLQCRNNGTMTDCPGACLIQGSNRSKDQCFSNANSTIYGMFVLGASNRGVSVNVFCNIHDCSSKGVTVHETTRTTIENIIQKDRATHSEHSSEEENSEVSNSTSVENSSGNSVFFNGLLPSPFISTIISILNL